MADALSVFNPPNSLFAGLGMPDQIELARLREAERLRTGARIAALETSLAPEFLAETANGRLGKRSGTTVTGR